MVTGLSHLLTRVDGPVVAIGMILISLAIGHSIDRFDAVTLLHCFHKVHGILVGQRSGVGQGVRLILSEVIKEGRHGLVSIQHCHFGTELWVNGPLFLGGV